MAFFRNSAVNLLNLHYGIHSIALGGGAAFFLVYLLKSGVPIPGVFVSLALILLGRFLIRPIVVGLAARWGLRALVVAGTLLTALQYPLLAEVHGVGAVLVGLCVVSAVSDTIYWSTYHAYFAALGDDEHRGQQVGAREAIAAIVGVASPLATGWLLVTFGPRVAFGATAVVVMLAALPVLWTPDVPVARHAAGAFRAALPGALLFAADGWIAASYAVVAVMVNALGALGGCLYTPTLMTAVYTQAKRSPCTLRFHVMAEGGWDVGGASGLLVAALLTALGAPLSASILLSLAGLAAMAVMLHRYYAGNPAVVVQVAE
jgi:hypothetical protein